MEIKSLKKLTDQRWLNLFEVTYIGTDGKEGKWIFTSRKKNPILGTDPLQADAVVIVAIHKGSDGKRRAVLVKEFRIPLGDFEWSFSAGLANPNESYEDVAKRELAEETGLTATKILYVSKPSVSSAGLSDESAAFVVCECEGEPNTDANESSEEITVQLMDVDELKALRNSNCKIGAKALPFFFVFEAMNEVNWPNN